MQVQSLGQEDPWRRAWQPTPVFLPEESHRQRSLAGHGPQGQELDTTEATQEKMLESLSRGGVGRKKGCCWFTASSLPSSQVPTWLRIHNSWEENKGSNKGNEFFV